MGEAASVSGAPAGAELATIALDVLLELTAEPRSRRLHRAWTGLRALLAPPPVAIAEVLATHEAGARAFARECEKEVVVRLELDPAVRVAAAVAEVVELAALHLIRTAIERGIESPDERDFALKPREGEVIVRCTADHERVVLEVRDDGRGGNRPDAALDGIAGRAAALGGTLALRTRTGEGATWTLAIPLPRDRVRVHKLALRGTPLPFAVTDDWEIQAVPHGDGAIDLIEELGLGPAGTAPITLELARGDVKVCLAAAAEAIDADARILARLPTGPIGAILRCDEADAVLLCPERLAVTAGVVAVADDSEIVRDLVACSLEPYGIQVVTFATAEPLIAALQGTTPVHLVLVDPAFKNLDIGGFIALFHAARPDGAVFLYSDRTPMELAALADQVHADGQLSKTLASGQFAARVLRILRARRAALGV
jgi:CheY-like chemotaxis protein